VDAKPLVWPLFDTPLRDSPPPPVLANTCVTAPLFAPPVTLGRCFRFRPSTVSLESQSPLDGVSGGGGGGLLSL
jgi:hypothetical protein